MIPVNLIDSQEDREVRLHPVLGCVHRRSAGHTSECSTVALTDITPLSEP